MLWGALQLSTHSLFLDRDRGGGAGWNRYVSRSALAAVLHDLGQPLAGIRALSSAPVADGRPSEAADELKDRLRQINELGEWMNELLRSGWATPATRPVSAGREGSA